MEEADVSSPLSRSPLALQFASYVGNAAPATAAKAAPAAPAAAPKAAPAPPPAKAAGAGFLAAYKTKSWNFTSKYGLSSPQNQGS